MFKNTFCRKFFDLTRVVSASIALFWGSGVFAQAPLSTTHFENAEKWSVYAAGDLELLNEDLSDIRVAYDGIFATPDGAFNLATYIDVTNVMFNGVPAHWMQWTFTSEEEGVGGVANLDLLIMDKKTGALKFRMLPSGQGSEWGGPYNFIGAGETEITRLLLTKDGEATQEIIQTGRPVFDFGGLPFVLPFMDLKVGKGVRLNAYQQSGADGVQYLDVKAIGPTKITDTRGNQHQVIEVQTMAPSRTTLISFYISKQAPYFYGWDYKKVDDGSSLFKMVYRGFRPTEIPR